MKYHRPNTEPSRRRPTPVSSHRSTTAHPSEVRTDVVARARALLHDPGYPDIAIIDAIVDHLIHGPTHS